MSAMYAHWRELQERPEIKFPAAAKSTMDLSAIPLFIHQDRQIFGKVSKVVKNVFKACSVPRIFRMSYILR
jgi:hypothetical protein